MTLPQKTLANGASMPQLGLGTFRIAGPACVEQVKTALALGYRHIDTAFYYQNHKDIAKAIRESGIARKELFITSKIWYDYLSYDDVLRYGRLAAQELECGYLDLLLIHWPNKSVPITETLRAMKVLLDEGTTRTIGVSNFTIPFLEEALHAAQQIGIALVCNQVEFHPFLYQRELLAFCNKHRLAIVAYRPLANGAVATDAIITAIATRHNVTGNQVSLRWLLDKGIAAIPKATSREHLTENLSLEFKLSEEETELLDNLPQQRLVHPGFAQF